jgi:ketosteroid isomerase-like protein
MSRENVDAIKASYEAFNRRDFDALFEYYDPDIVWEQDEKFVEPGTHYGHAGVRHVFESIFESFEDFKVEIEEIYDLDDQVLAILRIAGTAKLTGMELGTPGGHLFWFRDGKVVKLKLFVDPAEAREAAGVGASAPKSG